MRKFFFTLHCKMEVIMCKLKKVVHFIENGGKVFHEASHGEYRQESKNVSQFKKGTFLRYIFQCHRQNKSDK